MEKILHFIHSTPFFSHFKDIELHSLEKISEIKSVLPGENIDVKSNRFLYIILDGILELQSGLGKGDSLFLTKGSFFGEIPFADNKPRGTIKVISHAKLLCIKIEDVYKIFLESYKGARGYIKTIDQLGLSISSAGKEYFENSTRVITVCGEQKKSGKTIFSSLISHALSKKGETILLDVSYSGNSLFNIFNEKLIPAISQKQKNETTNESFLNERIKYIAENQAILNVAFGSKVKMNPELISPILFLLSKQFKYIVIDFGGNDNELEKEIFKCSDLIYSVCKSVKDLSQVYNKYDGLLNNGQKVIYVLNNYYDKNTKKIEGAYFLSDLKIQKKENVFEKIKKIVDEGDVDLYIEKIISKRKALIINSYAYESFAYSGLFTTLLKNNVSFDYIYSSFLSYILSAFFLVSKNEKDYLNIIKKFANNKRLTSLIDITFPEKSFLKNEKVYRFFNDIFKNKRIENFNTTLVGNFMREDLTQKLFSTGYLSRLSTVSYLLHPIFESFNINGMLYHSGYPHLKTKTYDIMRTDVDEIVVCDINFNKNYELPKSILPFYKNYIEFANYSNNETLLRTQSEKNIMIDVDFTNNNINDINKQTEEKWEKVLKENKILV